MNIARDKVEGNIHESHNVLYKECYYYIKGFNEQKTLINLLLHYITFTAIGYEVVTTSALHRDPSALHQDLSVLHVLR